MSTEMASVSKSRKCRRVKPMSPCGILVKDGSGRMIAHLLYDLATDVAIPVECDESCHGWFYGLWLETGSPLRLDDQFYTCLPPRKVPCREPACLCTGPVREMPYSWVQHRVNLAFPYHWLAENFKREEGLHSIYKLAVKNDCKVIVDTAEMWKRTWRSNHPVLSFLHPHEPSTSQKPNDVVPSLTPDYDGSGPQFDMLPFEVFEALVKYLDGVDVLNLCRTSPKLQANVIDALNSLPRSKKNQTWRRFCTTDLDRSSVFKILSSYDKNVAFNGVRVMDESANYPDWGEIFGGYLRYWRILQMGKVCTTDLKRLENKLKGDLFLSAEYDCNGLATGIRRHMTFCGGGKVLINLTYPPNNELNKANLVVVENMEEVDCKFIASVCKNQTTSSFLIIKMIHILVSTKHSSKDVPPAVDRVLFSVCDHCITLTPILGGVPMRMDLEDLEFTEEFIKAEPIVEHFNNIVAMWLKQLLVFYDVGSLDEGPNKGYHLVELYRLNFREMKDIWNKVAEHRSSYITIIREYGRQMGLLNNAVSNDGSSSEEPRSYGLALVSHIYGVESFVPRDSVRGGTTTIVESIQPQYYNRNARKYLPHLRQTTCSAKGHGSYVFCSNRAIAISWDCITWLFGKLEFPATIADESGTHNVSHVEVIHDFGLLAIVNENVVLLKVDVIPTPSKCVSDLYISEPILKVTPVRIFDLGLLKRSKEISHLELNFDEGEPFFLLIVHDKPKAISELGCNEKVQDGLNFVIKRLDFRM